jgi:hypothetical protein
MENDHTSTFTLPFGWHGVDLPCRLCSSTYELYRNIPEIPAIKYQQLNFLTNGVTAQDNISKYEHFEKQGITVVDPQKPDLQLEQSKLQKIITEYKVDDDFIVFMSSEELQERIPSCTACYFYLGDEVVSVSSDTTILLFYRDQQDCLGWYLVLTGPYKGNIVASTMILGVAGDPEEDVKYFPMESVVCAQSFSEFLYRTWVENHIWINESQ